MREQFVFTPVVHGAHDGVSDKGALHCTIHIGIRLYPASGSTQEVLGNFPGFASWPSRKVSVTVAFEDGTYSAVQTRPAIDSQLFASFFPPDQPVRTYPDPMAIRIPSTARSFDGAGILNYARKYHGAFGRCAFRMVPGLSRPRVWGHGTRPRVQAVAAGPLPTLESLRAARAFFGSPDTIETREKVTDNAKASNSNPPPENSWPDVHDLIAYLHDVPGALRAFGLAFDVTVPWPVTVPKPSSIGIVVTLDQSDVTVLTNNASVEITSKLDGLIAPDQITIAPFDHSHAAHVLGFAQEDELPALRSSGFSLLRAGEASNHAELIRRVARAQAIAQQPITKNAPLLLLGHDDTTIGYRVDVWDEQKSRWRSTSRISGQATRGNGTLPFDGEGFVSSSLTKDPNGTVRANDVIARWLGWSICARRPEEPSGDGSFLTPAGAGIKIVREVVPSTLPTLRFGHQYRFRVRKVDACGGGLPSPLAGDKDLTGATEAQTFLRTEPVGPPVFAFGTEAVPGESSTQMVIRSGPGLVLFGTQRSIRYVLPPDATIEFASMHGVFDTSQGVPEEAAYLRFREGSLWANGTRPAGGFPKKADLTAATTHVNGPPSIPYMPDPTTRAASFFVLDGLQANELTSFSTMQLAFARDGAAYPDGWAAATLALTTATDEEASAVVRGSVLTIALPPGRRVTLACASSIATEQLQKFAVRAWALDGIPPALHADYDSAAQAGAVPALSPPRIITLAHATQQPKVPVLIPSMIRTVKRDTGDTTLRLQGKVEIDLTTTAAVAIQGTWEEWIDNGPGAQVPSKNLKTVNFVDLKASISALPFDALCPFFGTRRASIAVTPIATSAFAEHFPAGVDCTCSGTVVEIQVAASQAPAPPRFAYAIPTFAWSLTRPSALSAVSVRRGNALRLYLERPWFTSGPAEKLAVIIASSPGQQSSYVSRWGPDPVSAAPPGPVPFGAADFIDKSVPRVSFNSWKDKTQNTGETVILALHDVTYDAATDHYFCDISFDEASFRGAYSPFVQLIIGAYQPLSEPLSDSSPDHSNPDSQLWEGRDPGLSATVTLPWLQVPSDRVLTVTLSEDPASPLSIAPSIFVGVDGPVPGGDFTRPVRGLGTQYQLFMAFDGSPIHHNTNPTGDPGSTEGPEEGDHGQGGHGHTGPIPSKSGPIIFKPGFYGSEDYVRGGSTTPWKDFMATIYEYETASFFTVDFTENLNPGTQQWQPGPGQPGATTRTVPSSPYPRRAKLVYYDQVTIERAM
jgi:hypothetical protein